MANIKVTNTADKGAGSLRDAIAKAQSNDIITFSLTSSAKITLTSGEITIPEAKNLTIDGTGVTNLTISANNNSRIFNIKSNSSSVNQLNLKNLILADGVAPSEPLQADGSTADTSQRGGAILSGSSSGLTLDNVTFNDNQAARGGGAIYSTSYTKLTVLNSKFNRNSGMGQNQERAGGAITFRGPDELIVKNSQFTDNKGVNGGAINTVHGKVSIDNCKFINNTTEGAYDPSQPSSNHGDPKTDSGKIRGYGGALYVDCAHESLLEPTGYIRIYGSVFTGNKGKGAGGAAYLYTVPGDKVIIDSSSFENNQVAALTVKPGSTLPPGYILAPGNGGAVNQTSNAGIGANAGFSVTNSTFANNTAANQGGGLWKNVSATTIVNSTFYGNKAGSIHNSTDNSEIGGGLMLYGQATVTNTTIANNFANWMGGGLAADSNSGVTVNNTIFFNNVANRGGASIKNGAQTNRKLLNGQNNIQYPNRTLASTDFLAVNGIRVINPKLGPLQDNGGATKTMALLSGSPAINAGANIGGVNRDQRGKIISLSGPRDIGAFEVSTSSTTPEVSVVFSGSAVQDGSMTPYNYGQTALGTPVDKTLTISNTGTGTLSLEGLQLPAGFSVVGNLPSSLAPGSQTSFQIRLSATKSGPFGGEVFFATNDRDENIFSFALAGSVTRVINGSAGANNILGDKSDEIINSGDGNDLIQANAGNDTVNAGAGEDTIAGGVGLNRLVGGPGNDSYTLNNPLDVVVEDSSPNSGTDILNIAANYTLGSNIENLGLLGTNDFNGTGNSLKNLITGNSGDNTLTGLQGNDNLRGMDGDDSLAGGEGNDILESGTGLDTLNGGTGNDSYSLENPNDVIIETSKLSTEIDRVTTTFNYTLIDNLEFLTITGGVATTATGNKLDNSILGNDLSNTLYGLQGDDTLEGGLGQDILNGGTGNDTYVVDTSSESIVETSTLSTEIDAVRAEVSYTLANNNVENLTLIGTATTGKGNSLNNLILGNEFNNTLSGGVGNDTISDASAGNDSLVGGAGNDNLNPGPGSDTMEGGTGNDIYYVDSAKDIVRETSTLNSELDNVLSSITYSLGSNLELLTLTGTGNLDGEGNQLSNNITGTDGDNHLYGGDGNDNLSGRDGNDTLTGGAGNDTLTGGLGSDTFIFTNASEKRDQITDFIPTQDIIHISTTGFGSGAIPVGPLSSNRLVLGTAATSINPQFLYDVTTGSLFFDADGIGIAAPEKFAILTNKPTITSKNIVATAIVNKDPLIAISASNVSVTEGSGGTTEAGFILSLSDPSAKTVTIDFKTADGIATAGSDYLATSGTLTFAPGKTSQTIHASVIGDTTVEPLETFSVNFAYPTNASLTTTFATGFIKDDDETQGLNYSISANTASLMEGQAPSKTPITFVVNRSGALDTVTSLRYGFIENTPTNNEDFQVASVTGENITEATGRITFGVGASLATITLNVMGDSTYELDEPLTVTLSKSDTPNTSMITAAATTLILNDEPLPSVKVNRVNQVEGNTGDTLANFVVYLNYTSPQAITVDFTTANGTAKAGSDYKATSGTVTFSPGQNFITVGVPVIGDNLYEANENFTLDLSNPTKATIGTTSGSCNILNDDFTLVGSTSADTLIAGSANNTLIGQGGADILTGGQGNDRYVYNAMGDKGDIITDFRVGQDKINLTNLMDSLGYTGLNPISEGYVKFVSTTSGGTSATRIDIDPDGSAGKAVALPYIFCQKVHVFDMNSPNNFVF